MSEAILIAERGSRLVDRQELSQVETPEPEGRWLPLSHSRVLDVVTERLTLAGYDIAGEQFALAKNDQQFFATLDIRRDIADGVSLAVGIRNSTNRTLSAAAVFGNRVMVCSNLCFSGEIQISRKHTTNGEQGFELLVSESVLSLRKFEVAEATNIKTLKSHVLNSDQAAGIMLRAFEKRVVGAHLLPKLINEWRNPSFEDFETRTAWSLLNCFTTLLRDRFERQPISAAAQTIGFQKLLTG